MTSRDFCFWLQGFFEITMVNHEDGVGLAMSGKQLDMIKRHLALVFKHEIDPSMGDEKHQDELNKIHSPEKKAPPVPPGSGGKDPVLRC